MYLLSLTLSHATSLRTEFDTSELATAALTSFAVRRCICMWLELSPGTQEFSSTSVVTSPQSISTFELPVTIKEAQAGASTYYYIHVASSSSGEGGDYLPTDKWLSVPFNTADPDGDGDGDGDSGGFGDDAESSGFGDDDGDDDGGFSDDDDDDGGDGFSDDDDDDGGAVASKTSGGGGAAASKTGGSGEVASKVTSSSKSDGLEAARAEWSRRGEEAAFELARKLVAEDCLEVNRIPGVRAGFSFPSASSPCLVWLAIDLSTRYHIDAIRADALMMEDDMYVVQRIDFGSRYWQSRSEQRAGADPGEHGALRPADVSKHACGQSDVMDLMQPKLIFERAQAALLREQRLALSSTADRDVGTLRPFGVRGVIHESIRGGAHSASVEDVVEGGLIRRPWDTATGERVDAHYHQLLLGLAQVWDVEENGPLTLDPLMMRYLGEAFNTHCNEFPAAAQLMALLKLQSTMEGGFPLTKKEKAKAKGEGTTSSASDPPAAPIMACEAHAAALKAFAQSLSSEDARMTDARRKAEALYARYAAAGDSVLSALDTARLADFEARSNALLEALIAEERADGESASMLIQEFSDPAQIRALLASLKAEEEAERARKRAVAAAKSGAATKDESEKSDDEAGAYMWQFDAGGDTWSPFEAAVIATIESSFESGHMECEYVREGGGASYTVTNLQACRDDSGVASQTRASSSVIRKIRRITGRAATLARLKMEGTGGSWEDDGSPLTIGDTVRVKASVSKPSHGWGSVKHGHVGQIARISGSGCTVNFPGNSSWSGVLSEMERAGASGDGGGGGGASGESAAARQRRLKGLQAGASTEKTIDITAAYGALSQARTEPTPSLGIAGFLKSKKKKSKKKGGASVPTRTSSEMFNRAKEILLRTPPESSPRERALYLNRLRASWRARRASQAKKYELSKITPFLLRYGGGSGSDGGASSASPPRGGAFAPIRPGDLRTQRQGSSGRAGSRPGGAGSSFKSTTARIARTKRVQMRLQHANVLVRCITRVDEAMGKLSTHCMIPSCGAQLTFLDKGVLKPKTSAVPVPCMKPLCQQSMIAGGVGVELAAQLMHNKDLFTLLMTFLNAVTTTSIQSDRFFGSYPAISIGGDSFGGKSGVASRKYQRIASAVQKMPTFEDLCTAAAHGDTELRRLLTSRDQLLSMLMNWVLGTNSTCARLLPKAQRLGHDAGQSGWTPYQFVLTAGSPEEERTFQEKKSDLLTVRMVLKTLKSTNKQNGLWKAIEGQKAKLTKEGRVWHPEAYIESHDQMRGGVPYGLFGGQDKLPRPRAMLRLVEAALERVHEMQAEAGEDADDDGAHEDAGNLVITRTARAKEVSATVRLLASTSDVKDLARQVIVEAMDDINWWGNGSGQSGSGNGCPGEPGSTGISDLNSIDPLNPDLTGCSFFAYHGSALGNWHSLFRVGCTNVTLIPGVNTTNAFGPGIYFGVSSATSMGYSGNGGDCSNFWKGERSGGFVFCLASFVSYLTPSSSSSAPSPPFIQARRTTRKAHTALSKTTRR